MINKRLFMSKVVAEGYTQKTLSRKMNKCSKNTLNSRINNKTQMKLHEITEICTILNINSDAEKIAIFLS